MSDIYHTPQEAIDVVMAQPEMDAVQRLAEDGSPHPDGRADTTEDGPAAVTPRHRHVSCEVYNLAGIDFARQQNARGLIVYTSLLGDGCGGPQPRAWNMTIMRDSSGWLVSLYGTFGARMWSLALPSGKRDDVERVARRTLEAFVARKLHAAKCEHLWRVRKAIRRQAEAQFVGTSADGSPISAGAAVRPGGPGCPGCPGKEAAQ